MRTGTKIITLDNGYHIWTHTSGHGHIHLLALHGGPGGTPEYWENAAQELKKQGLDVQVTMYDQLGSWYSDTPDLSNPKIAKRVLTYKYFIDELDEVRRKLGLDNFYLIGQSWGGLMVQEYAANPKLQKHLKGAIISSMVSDIDDYTKHLNQIRDHALPADDVAYMKKCEKTGNYDNARYQKCVDKLNRGWIDRTYPPAISHLVDINNEQIYHAFQGDNEFVVTGKLKQWHFTKHLKDIHVPTLITFGQHESMPISAGKRMAKIIPNAKFVSTPHGGHHHMIDNAPVYYKHLADFIRQVENGTFNK